MAPSRATRRDVVGANAATTSRGVQKCITRSSDSLRLRRGSGGLLVTLLVEQPAETFLDRLAGVLLQVRVFQHALERPGRLRRKLLVQVLVDLAELLV